MIECNVILVLLLWVTNSDTVSFKLFEDNQQLAKFHTDNMNSNKDSLDGC